MLSVRFLQEVSHTLLYMQTATKPAVPPTFSIESITERLIIEYGGVSWENTAENCCMHYAVLHADTCPVEPVYLGFHLLMPEMQ